MQRQPGDPTNPTDPTVPNRASHIGSSIVTGVVLATVNTLLTIALMSLVFRGDLAEHLPVGIGLGLASSAVIGLVIALTSSFPGLFAGVQDTSSAIIGLSASAIVGVVAGPQLLDTVLVMIALTSAATGIVFLAMGHLGLGDIARFVPFPVIGGLLAGTGYLILMGSIGLLQVENVGSLAEPESLGLFWPAVTLAVLFFGAARLRWSSGRYLVMLVVSFGGFHAMLRLAGVSAAEALERGWLLGPFPEGGLWPTNIFAAAGNTDWSAVAGQTTNLVTILVIVPITLLLYISALEVETKVDVSIDRELRATGWANLAASTFGGPPGYVYLGDTIVVARLVGRRRIAAVVSPLVLLVFAALGGSVLQLVPRFIIGGLLLFVGLEFVYEWLWSSRRRMTGPDYLLMWAIVLIIATGGFLTGVGFGLVAAVGLFVLRYSSIDVIKHKLTGVEQQSNVERSIDETKTLNERGTTTLILELQGYIFFGTATKIIHQVRQRLEDPEPLHHLVVDFRRVTGVDSTAVATLERVTELARDNEMLIIFTGLGDSEREQFSELTSENNDVLEIFPDLDHGLARCESNILKSAEPSSAPIPDLPSDLPAALAPYLDEMTFEPGQVLMREGDQSPGIYLIRSGRATVLLEGANSVPIRLRTLLSGTVIGEISLYRNEPCTATVVADGSCEVLHLSPTSFAVMGRSDPQAAAELHAFVVRALAARVEHANRTIRALRD